jgi:diadenosine tetraphosphate (Ap4A) HIT family hydrolase
LPRLKVAVDQTETGTNVTPSHSDLNGFSYRTLDTFGTRSAEFANAELRRLIKALGPNSRTVADEETLNAALAVVDGIKPENEIEAMLACKMAMTHVLAMQAMARAHWAEMLSEYQAAGSFAIKLTRTFTMQMEALAKLRRGGNQTVRVEHVHVHSGGQAIVGNVTGAGGGGVPEETGIIPMHSGLDLIIRQPLPFRLAPRCGARTRSGTPCQSPRVRHKTRCRMHGGAKGSGAPRGPANGRYRHGLFTCEAIEERRMLRAMIADMRATTDEILS